MTNAQVWFCLWMCIPILPAFMLFKFLSSRARASGPLHGLKIRVGGAFAGYVILVCLTYPLVKDSINQDAVQKWIITGDIALEGGGGAPQLATILVHPPGPPIDETGHFSLEIARPIGSKDPIDDPHLVIQYPGYVPYSIVISAMPKSIPASSKYGAPDYNVKIDAKTHTIAVSKITLKKTPAVPYTPALATQDPAP